ncbi:IS4 family transposase [Anaeromyxobacter sp. Fw109-5]|uniref:IS4 family transposase n=1 Tax=Anaeromyxobacter sp. (strain Fw109-5) TaxID=404589 RepID=UPI0000ED89FE|nr:IS4 family transposase [Anaeromyxobacter sp. Fw109-5]ABS25509.1 putative transposase [Anaeromyxobacter sp. Fw109-5]ABS27274.1 putative transposase [Anaeromyxobacter sp. Fw109-5]
MTRHDIGRADFLRDELRAADFNDERLTRRLSAIATSLAADPSSSFPEAAADDAALEGTYRFFNNPKVTPERCLGPHVRRTIERAAVLRRVFVVHDTSQFNFGLFPRKGLGRVGRGRSYGFFGHFALAVAADGSRLPLGVLGLHTLSRTEKAKRLKHGKNQENPDNSSLRWRALFDETNAALAGKASAVHVMDREGDNYALFSHMVAAEARFVVRLATDRRLPRPPNQDTDGEHTTVTSAMRDAPVLAEREVPLATRRRQQMPSTRKRHPARISRVAKLQVSAGQVTIPRPVTSNRSPHAQLTLNLVHVAEVDTPPNSEPVEWWLWTNESVATTDDVLAVVDTYRARWVIEEFFKSLKTGCSIEKRQLESGAALLNALAVLASVAWRLLALRTLARDASDAPAATALTSVQVKCLRFAYKKRRKRELPESLTVREAMLAVAALGGHLVSNGDPGWQVLGRGFEKLLSIEEGYFLALETARGEM